MLGRIVQNASSYCAELVRSADRDRFIATLFAPAHSREALYALYAFNLELSQIRDRARQAAAGEIRLQWWLEVLQGDRRSEAMASPVAASLLNTIENQSLRVDTMAALVEAHRFDLYDEPIQTIAEFEDYARNTASAVFQLAAEILGVDTAAAAGPVGIAYAVAALLADLPRHAARRQCYLPLEFLHRHGAQQSDLFAGQASPALNRAAAELRDLGRTHLDAAANSLRSVPAQALPAFLPIAPVRRSFDCLQRSDVFSPKGLSPWRRQWLIWRAAHDPKRLAG